MGSYGLGAKSPLSTMTPFYTMQSAYNGQFYKLNIYSKKIDDLIGPFNLETGEENKFITLSNGAKLYYEATKSKNCTEIIVPVKKLNKHRIIEAVKTQLLYLPNVTFHTFDESGYKQEVRFKANVIHNSENLIISDNSRYSRPHLIVVKDKSSNVGICYNEINYKELELEQRYGQVGLKVQMRAVGKDANGDEYLISEGVTVTPNREQVIWNDDTKNYLLKITRGVAEEAAEIVNKELVEPDFLKWLEKAHEALNNSSRGVLGELSKMIDKSNIVPTYSVDKSVKFKNPGDIFWGMWPRVVQYENVWVRSTGSHITKVRRVPADSWNDIAGYNVYLKLDEGPASNTKDQYILQVALKDASSYDKKFILLELNDTDKQLDELLSKTAATLKADVEEKFNKKRAKSAKILEYIKASKLFKSYDDLVVPDDFKVAAEEAEEKVAVIEAKETATLEELRKANGEIVFFTPRLYNQYDNDSALVWDKIEKKVTEVTSWTTEKVYYGFQADSEMLQCACRILGREQNAWFNKKIKIVKIAQKNEKHFKAIGEHISNFWYQLNGDVIVMDDEVKAYYTARLVCKKVTENSSLNFFSNYEKMDKRVYDIYQYLLEYGTRFSDTMKLRSTGVETEKQLFEQLTKYGEFQIFVMENSEDAKAIADKSKELFGTDLVKNAPLPSSVMAPMSSGETKQLNVSVPLP